MVTKYVVHRGFLVKCSSFTTRYWSLPPTQVFLRFDDFLDIV